MQKGKFGFSLWLYPYISLWALFLNMNLVPFLIAGFVIAVEKDEWASKQCLHTIMICVYFGMYRFVMGLFTGIPMLGLVFSVIDMIVNLVFFILVFILGFMKLKNGKSINMFGMGIVNRAFGQMLQYVQMDSPQPTPQPTYTAPVMEQPVAPQPTYAPPAPAPVQPIPQPTVTAPMPSAPPPMPTQPMASPPMPSLVAPAPISPPEPSLVAPPMPQPESTQTVSTQFKTPPPPPSF